MGTQCGVMAIRAVVGSGMREMMRAYIQHAGAACRYLARSQILDRHKRRADRGERP